MALNDDDKQFLTDSISSMVSKAVSDKMDEIEKRTDYKQKQIDLEKQQQREEDREEYLSNLQKLNDAGVATMAQKFELIKTTIDKAVPQDLKNVATGMSKTFGKGANQIGKGLSTITGNLANLTPLTAMLWKNRAIFTALGNVVGGGFKIGWGITKGIAGGIGSIFNALLNRKNKKKAKTDSSKKSGKKLFGGGIGGPVETSEPEEVEETKKLALQLPSLPGLFQAKTLTQQKSKMEKQVSEIHTYLLGNLNHRIKRQINILSKGLDGLQKGMKAVQVIMTAMKAKQLLIVAGILAGVAAIAMLAKWFQEGGLANLIKGIKNMTPEAVEKSAEGRINTAIDVTSLSGLNTKTKIAYLNKNFLGNEIQDRQEIFKGAGDKFWKGSQIKEGKKVGAWDDATLRLLEDPKHRNGNLNASTKQYKTSGQGIKVAFPVKIKIIDVELNEKSGTASALIERVGLGTRLQNSGKTAGKGTKAGAKGGAITLGGAGAVVTGVPGGALGAAIGGALGAAGGATYGAALGLAETPRLIVEGIIQLLVPKNKPIPENTYCFVVGPMFKIVGDEAAFFGEQGLLGYENSIQADATMNANYETYIDNPENTEALAKDYDRITRKENLKKAAVQTYTRDIPQKIKNMIKGESPESNTQYDQTNDNTDNSGTSVQTTNVQPTKTQNGPGSTNQQKNDSTNNEIQKTVTNPPSQKQTAEQKNMQTGNNTQSQPPQMIVRAPRDIRPPAYSTQMTLNEYNKMIPQNNQVNTGTIT